MKLGDKIPAHLALLVYQGGERLLILEARWIDGRSDLHIKRNNMNSDGYVQVLERHTLLLSSHLDDPSTDWILMMRTPLATGVL